MESLVSQLVDILLLPPGINFLLFGGAFYLKTKFPRLSLALVSLSLSTLFLLSLPFVANSFANSLENIQPLNPKQVIEIARKENDNLAIVVLSGGRRSKAEEYGGIDTVSSKTLQRIQYAAWLYRKTNIPILVSGGSVNGEATAESVLINQTMLSAFNIAPKWIESESKNTKENAIYSSAILKKQGIERIILVTHANHMQRAMTAFEKQGLSVIPAPTVFNQSRSNWSDYFPNAKAMFKSQKSLHERIGRWWYNIGNQ